MLTMMRLVTQFDDRRSRATVATPTCCCCCCCCVASVVSTTVVTVLNVDEVARSAPAPAPAPASQRWLYGAAAVAVLPLALFVAGAANALTQDEGGLGTTVGLLAFFVVWTGALVLLYRQAGLRSCARPVGATVTLGTALFLAELFLAASFVLESEGSFAAYLVVAALVPFGVVPLLRSLSMDRP
jgi:hypothetical protein